MEKKLTVIIADGSEQLCQQIAAEVQQNENFAVVGLAYDGKQATELVRQNRPDILVLDMMLPERDGIAVLRDINSMETKPTVIATSSFVTDYVASVANQLGARYLLLKPIDKALLVERMVELVNLTDPVISDDVLETYIIEALHDTGMPANILGYECLQLALKIAIRNKNAIRDVSKSIYIPVAERLDTTPKRVQQAIKRAIDIGWDRGELDTLQGYFGCTVSNCKGMPTNSEYIAIVAEKIRLRIKDGEELPQIIEADEKPAEVISKTLHEIGMPVHIKGYQYAHKALLIAVEDPFVLKLSVSKVLYHLVAEAFNTTPTRVDRAISHAIEMTWDRGDVATLRRFFGYTINRTKGKPTNSEFIAIVAEYICQALKAQKTD